MTACLFQTAQKSPIFNEKQHNPFSTDELYVYLCLSFEEGHRLWCFEKQKIVYQLVDAPCVSAYIYKGCSDNI